MEKRIADIWKVLETVNDPEVPVVSVVDLGMIREVCIANETIVITLTPTYSGCPATDVINMSIRMAMLAAGYKNFEIKMVLSPAWTTEWISAAGKQKLKAYGIAPPNDKQVVCEPEAFSQEEAVQCPHCNSYHTTQISRFGSTPCKALYKCNDCLEPFDYFKCH